jgi:hypothetical protein
MLGRGNGYHVDGFAVWGEDRPYGPNIGDLQFAADLENDALTFSTPNGDEIYRVSLSFVRGGTMEVNEENWLGMYGMNVTFAGTYRRVSPTRSVLRALGRAFRRTT